MALGVAVAGFEARWVPSAGERVDSEVLAFDSTLLEAHFIVNAIDSGLDGTVAAPRDEPIAVQLLRVRQARGLSRSTLSRMTATVGDLGVSEAAINLIERGRTREPTDRTIVALADALGASDEEFPAGALARARVSLDERVQGMEAAWQRLQRFHRNG